MDTVSNTSPDWMNAASRQFLGKGYIEEGETPESRIDDIALAFCERLVKEGLNRKRATQIAARFHDYMIAGFYSLSSPVWANFGKTRGLPISCNGSYIEDNTAEIMRKVGEIGMMTKHGAGTSAYIGALRHRGAVIRGGGSSNGPVGLAAPMVQATVNTISQSNVRRGNCALYMNVDHKDIMEFLEMREEGHPVQDVSLGVCISDEFMRRVEARDPHAMTIMARIVRKRMETGYPYIIFIDTMNRGRPQVWKDQNLPIYASNLCSEIAQPSSETLSFVCALMSMNDALFDLWKNTDAVEVAMWFIDTVLGEYVEKIEAMPAGERFFMEDALRFSKLYRTVGIGRLGTHDLYQSKMLPFGSSGAKLLNVEIQKLIDKKSLAASRDMAAILGEPEGMKGTGERNATRQAIAPTTSSSFILGQVSPSVEPHNSNYYTKDLAKGSFTYKNPKLKEILGTYEKDTPEVWRSIMMMAGSVQHLEFLSDHEKAVFRTFAEIDQADIIIQAAHRQRYIDQAQSINVMVPAGSLPKVTMAVIMQAWEQGLKSLYYQRSTNAAQEVGRKLSGCVSCEA